MIARKTTTAEERRRDRALLILAGFKCGLPQSRIARALGLSGERVRQIVGAYREAYPHLLARDPITPGGPPSTTGDARP